MDRLEVSVALCQSIIDRLTGLGQDVTAAELGTGGIVKVTAWPIPCVLITMTFGSGGRFVTSSTSATESSIRNDESGSGCVLESKKC